MKKQQSFFKHDCAELDSVYEYLASIGQLTQSRKRPPRRGWTRQDINRAEFLATDIGELPVLPSVGRRGKRRGRRKRISTRVLTAYRVLPVKQSINLAFKKAVEFCEQNPVFSDGDIKIIRKAVEKHWQWLDAYVHMSEERPMYAETNHEYFEAIGALEELAKTTEPFSRKPNEVDGVVRVENPGELGSKTPVDKQGETEERKMCAERNQTLASQGVKPGERLTILRAEFPNLNLDASKLKTIYRTHRNRQNNAKAKKS